MCQEIKNSLKTFTFRITFVVYELFDVSNFTSITLWLYYYQG